MASRVYSQHLGEISAAQLQAALDRFDLGTLIDAEPTQGGLFGMNMFVTSTAGRFVLRGCAIDPGMFAQEQFFARCLHEQTMAPTPWPYLHDPSTDIFSWDYVLMQRLPGQRLCEVETALEAPVRLALAREMGETLAETQRCVWPVPAMDYHPATRTMAPQEKTHYARVTDAIAESLATTQTACPTSTMDEDCAWVNVLVRSAREALEEPFTPRLVLHDFTVGNVNAELREEQWRIVGVFDLHESFFGDGEEGLSRTFCNYLPTPEFAEAFLTAYASRRPLRPGFQTRFPIYVLADCLHIWSFGHTRASWYDPSLRLRVWLEPTLAAVEQLLRSYCSAKY